jgi:hypothetical protein
MTTRRRDEHGAVAILVAMLCVVLFGCAALAVDLTSQTDERQRLHDTLDTAALSGAMLLPDAAAAEAQALAVVAGNDPAATPDVNFYCITGSTGTPPAVDETFIPTACDPGPAPYNTATYAGLRCNASICAIPCVPSTDVVCNAIELNDEKAVPFGFANVLGISEGSTGSLTTVACKGGCGQMSSNPIDFAIVADRTGSMTNNVGSVNDIPATGNSLPALEQGVESLLEYLTPSMNRVALGTIGHSSTTAPTACLSKAAGNDPSTTGTGVGRRGNWIIPSISGGTPYGADSFTDQYDLTDVDPPSSPPDLNTSDFLVKAVNCISNDGGDSTDNDGGASSTGTWLASPMKFAAKTLIAHGRPDPVRKGIIFMTDGVPNEQDRNVGDSTADDLDNDKNIGDHDEDDACDNAQAVAANAKDKGIIVATIAYRMTAGDECDNSRTVLDSLAAMASPRADGTPSVDDGGGLGAGCDTLAKVDGENSDGDYFFCAATPESLKPIFVTAAVTVAGGTRLMWMP